MKSIFLFCASLFLCVSLKAQAPPKKTNSVKTEQVKPAVKDTTVQAAPQLTDATELISVSDLAQFSELLKDRLTVNSYEIVMDGLRKIIQVKADAWKQKQAIDANKQKPAGQ